MKRLIIAIIFSFVLILLCFASYLIVNNEMESLKEIISQIENLDDDDFKEYTDLANKCEKNFYSREALMSFFVDHDKLDELKENFAIMRSYCNTKQKKYLLTKCAETRIVIHDILEDQRFCPHSIF